MLIVVNKLLIVVNKWLIVVTSCSQLPQVSYQLTRIGAMVRPPAFINQPSFYGKRLHNYGKSSFFMAIFIFGHFQQQTVSVPEGTSQCLMLNPRRMDWQQSNLIFQKTIHWVDPVLDGETQALSSWLTLIICPVINQLTVPVKNMFQHIHH